MLETVPRPVARYIALADVPIGFCIVVKTIHRKDIVIQFGIKFGTKLYAETYMCFKITF